MDAKTKLQKAADVKEQDEQIFLVNASQVDFFLSNTVIEGFPNHADNYTCKCLNSKTEFKRYDVIGGGWVCLCLRCHQSYQARKEIFELKQEIARMNKSMQNALNFIEKQDLVQTIASL